MSQSSNIAMENISKIKKRTKTGDSLAQNILMDKAERILVTYFAFLVV